VFELEISSVFLTFNADVALVPVAVGHRVDFEAAVFGPYQLEWKVLRAHDELSLRRARNRLCLQEGGGVDVQKYGPKSIEVLI